MASGFAAVAAPLAIAWSVQRPTRFSSAGTVLLYRISFLAFSSSSFIYLCLCFLRQIAVLSFQLVNMISGKMK